MKAFLLLIIVSIAVFFAASTLPAPGITPIEQITEIMPEELSTLIPILSEENLEEQKESLPEIEIEEVVMAVEEKHEIISDTPDDIPVQVEEVPTPEGVGEKPKTSFSEINTNTREALVNILCTTKSGGSFKPITGSGIMIDERGIILTNAHVAQYFLLKDYLTKDFIECTIRTGSPARARYKANPIFISPSWIKENANRIIQQTPKGTGEDDYAFLLVTGRTSPGEDLPESFSFIYPLYNSGNIEVGDDILLAAYPAGFLGGISIQRDLYVSSTVTKVIELFTFESGALDVFSIGGSVVAQQGSSGGAVVGDENKLLGIIVTSSAEESTQDRDLRAITIGHINRSFVKDTGFDLQTLFSGNIAAEADAFEENIAPELTQLLVDELER